MSKPVFIDDGYTETKELEYGVTIKFRPCVGSAKAQFTDSLECREDGTVLAASYREKSNEMLSKHLLEIDGDKGPFSAEKLDTMNDELFEQVRVAVFALKTKETDAKN